MAPLIVSTGAAAGVILLALKLGIRKILAAEALLDLLIAGLLMASLLGTTISTTILLTVGLTLSVGLTMMKETIGHEKLEIKEDVFGKKHLAWTTVPGSLID